MFQLRVLSSGFVIYEERVRFNAMVEIKEINVDNLKELIKSKHTFNEKNARSKNFNEVTYNTFDAAREVHYRDISKTLTDELKQKMKLRRNAMWFMFIFVGTHLLSSILILGFVVWNRLSIGIEVVSDKFMLTFLISPLVNFLTSLGIIFKYLFSQTSETYDYLKNFIKFED